MLEIIPFLEIKFWTRQSSF